MAKHGSKAVNETLKGLNTEQRRAATHGDGPLLVLAGAGTGKTQTLVARVAYLLLTGVAAARILLLTFTRRAAQEMISRARRLAGPQAGDVRGGTFHATAKGGKSDEDSLIEFIVADAKNITRRCPNDADAMDELAQRIEEAINDLVPVAEGLRTEAQERRYPHRQARRRGRARQSSASCAEPVNKNSRSRA